MKISFGAQVIALGWDFNGFDAVTGFKPKMQQSVQWKKPSRAPFATPLARGIRTTTLSGRIAPATAPSVAEAMINLESLLNSLPSSGVLVKQVGNSIVTYAFAVLQSFESVDDMDGVSYAFELVFAVGAPTPGHVLVNKDGSELIVNKDGVSPLQNKS